MRNSGYDLFLRLFGLSALIILLAALPGQPGELKESAVVDLADHLEQMRLGAGEEFRISRLVEDEGQSALLVQVRSSLAPHFHRHTREVVYLLDGEGVFLLDAQRIPIRTGAVLRIQPQQVHTFVNQGSAPAVFLVVTSPRFEEQDRIMVENEAEPPR
jgi:mannose-6-phosphate isomerase-like protein (cupin superfamily)